MELILNLVLANKFALYQLIGIETTDTLIKIYEGIVRLLNEVKYPIGFDLYESIDGINFFLQP